MKCKSWSNKLSNFFTKKLKSLKMNGQSHQQQKQSSSQNNIPAGSKENDTGINISNLEIKDEHQCESLPPEQSRRMPDNILNGTLAEAAVNKTSQTPLRDAAISNSNCQGLESVTQLPSQSTAPLNHNKSSKSSKIIPKKTDKDFIFGKFIGEGSYSTVYLGRDVHTKRTYAIKVCNKQHIVRENKQEYVRREREALAIISGTPGFVNLFCTFQDHRALYFVMTYAKYGDLLPFINKVGSFEIDCARHYAAELVLALEQMHGLNIVHRDLKPENILLDENMHILIADFGCSKILTSTDVQEQQNQLSTLNEEVKLDQEDKKCEECCSDDGDDVDENSENIVCRQKIKRKASFVGTAQYVSPEVLENGPINVGVDLWALGCIMYQMISGLPPFRAANEYLIFKEIVACNLEFPEGFDSNAEDLIRKLLKIDPNDRLGAQDEDRRYQSIRKHPFFEGIDFDSIRETTPPQILPYFPGGDNDEDLYNHRIPDNLEPGLDENQLRRLLCMELGTGVCNDNDLLENNSAQTESNIFPGGS